MDECDGMPKLVEYENFKEQAKWVEYIDKVMKPIGDEFIDTRENGLLIFNEAKEMMLDFVMTKFPTNLTKEEYDKAVRDGVFDPEKWKTKE